MLRLTKLSPPPIPYPNDKREEKKKESMEQKQLQSHLTYKQLHVPLTYLNSYQNWVMHLWGQILASSSEGLRIKSTKALLGLLVGNGGGSRSTTQCLFLANPWCSRAPWIPNCIWEEFCISCLGTKANKGRKEFEEEKNILEENILEYPHRLPLEG